MKAKQEGLPLGEEIMSEPVVQEAQELALSPAPLDMTSPIGLMAYALQMGRTDALKDLVELKFRIDADEARKAFARELVAFQAEAPALPRVKEGLRTENGKVVSWYSPLDVTYRTLRPFLFRHGFAVRCDLEPIDAGHIRVTHVLTHALGHEARSSMIAQAEGTKLANASQKMGGGVTIAKRVTLKAVLGLEEEDEGGHFDEVGFLDAGAVADLRKSLAELGIIEARFLSNLGTDSFARLLDTPQMDARIRQILAARRKALSAELDAQAAREGGAE